MDKGKFREWFDTFVEEKGLDQQYKVWNLESPNGTWNHIDSEVVIEFIQNVTDEQLQNDIKTNIVKIDFYNGDVFHFFEYIAQGLVNNYGEVTW